MFKTNQYSFNLLFIVTIFILLAFSPNARAQDEAEKLGKEIYEKYQTAIGGKENLEKIKTVETISEIEAMGTKKKETRIEDKTNKKFYTVSEGGIEGKQESGFDGTRGWTKNMSFRGYRDTPRTSVSAKQVKKIANETIDGKEYFVLQSTNNNITVKSFYDSKTYLLARTETNGEVSGIPISQTITYGDYRKVGDILVPFSEVLTNTHFTINKKVLSVRQNIEVDPKIFEFSDDSNKKEEKNDAPKSTEQTPKQPMVLNVGANTVFKDETGNLITQAEFRQKQSAGNYLVEPEIADGKLVGMKLKKGSNETAIGTIPPDFNATLLDNSPIQLSQLKGKVVVLNFWFVECAPCIKEMPELNELVKKYQGKDVEFVAITYNEKSQVTDFLKRHQFDYKQIVDAQNIIDSYKTRAFPTHIVLDKEGKIKFTQFGLQTGIIQNLTKNIDDALGASTKVDWDKKNPEAIVPESIKKETLEKVWSTINNTYWDKTFNGVDWNAVKTKYEPQLTNVKTNQNLTDLMNKMVGELKQSHLKVHPANVIAINGDTSGLPKSGSIGVDTRLVNKSELVVTAVRKDSPAEKAGIKKGYTIKKVDGETISEIAQKQRDKGGFQLRDEIVAPRAVRDKLSGDLNKKVSVTLLDENDTEKTVELERQDLGISRDLTFESKDITQDVGYIKFNIFIGDLPTKFAEAVATMQNKKALIIDVRGNPGGVGNHTTALAALLDQEKRSLGVSQYRYSKQQFDYEGNDKSFKGKVFILVDEMSASSAEILAAGLQAHKRATIIGQNSAGAVLPSTMEILPNGGALQYAIGDYKTPDGKILEGRGVIPDVEVKLTRKDLLAGRDLVIETALKLAKE